MAKKLGIIGGLGPVATAYFYELISRMTDAYIDQDHIDIDIISKPTIPDRTDYILGRSSCSPLPHMIDIGKTLESMGADYIAIPCITAHYFHKELSDNIMIPIIYIIDETIQYLNKHGIKNVGIMATEGTIESGLFQKELSKAGIIPIIPSKQKQALVTSLIYKNVKAGLPANMEWFRQVTDELVVNGAEIIVLGCTELSLIKRDNEIGSGFIDCLEVLAMCSVTKCEASLKSEYLNLIS